ncbi:hypothetical protein JYU34_003320 [Plutella xylostella]|uniref:Shufflon protein C n=1 Tax=Plutella xylostella TaxID=51655 RepID=A0ABQ7QZR8_PLUXY|nr:hypothetical protein JYU34_003320 [Plutella xylostella]
MYSNGMWQARLTTNSGSWGRQMTKNIAKGLNSMQAPNHIISSQVGANTTCSSIVTSLRLL